jgi:hypothetical protein
VPRLPGVEEFLRPGCLGTPCYSCEGGCQSSWKGTLERSQMGRKWCSSRRVRLVAGVGRGGDNGSGVGLGWQISHF